ncbi:DUF821 domain-containing protein [Aulographum hederae CBS 113979]|uniref:DUF821 domain-containing protein n=1 Tax=Aulographum hederae CBS 113979 TaxID=1176131 RepID=A0A6G1GJU6_9PEZI|nr:DUF821 domain-containing protein [Aulographum hederae CBS 113979]
MKTMATAVARHRVSAFLSIFTVILTALYIVAIFPRKPHYSSHLPTSRPLGQGSRPTTSRAVVGNSEVPLLQTPSPVLPSPPVATRPIQFDAPAVPAELSGDYGLSDEQCDLYFPDLYQEIDRAASYARDHGNISTDDLDISWKKDGLVRAMIHDRKLYILNATYSGAGYNIRRSLAILGSINRAMVAYQGPIPDTEFTFSVNDIADPDHVGKPVWTFSRLAENEQQWLMPDFGYWSWELELVGEYEDVRSRIAAIEEPFLEKTAKALWRGAKNNDLRTDLLRVAEESGSQWGDIQEIKWASRTRISSHTKGNAIPIPEHCKYQYLIQTEGASYSGRGKYLQNCNSVVIIHKRRWIENYHHLLIADGPHQNFVEVERNFSDLPQTMHDLVVDPANAEKIANNSVKMFRDRYLTPAAQACYWRRLLSAWSEVSPKPELYDAGDVADQSKSLVDVDGGRKLRGIPYETYVLTAFDQSLNCGWFRRMFRRC